MRRRLDIAIRELKALKHDRLFNHVCGPADVAGLARLRESLALLEEAGMYFAVADHKMTELPLHLFQDVPDDTGGEEAA